MVQANGKGNIGIVVSGGPAPGINSVISASTIEAVNRGYGVKGLRFGFKGIVEDSDKNLINLDIQQVSSIYNSGGSILGTSRFNPLTDPQTKRSFFQALRNADISKLIVVGGEGSAFLSHAIAAESQGLQVVHVPKTIDNDLILPNKHPSFGFETACAVGVKILETLMVDAKTTERWFLVTSMGRKSRFLALGLGIASGATLTLIPEEFEAEKSQPEEIANIIYATISSRAKEGKPYGVVIVAEGLLDCLDPDSHPILRESPRDQLGRLKYSQIEIADLLLPYLKEKAKKENSEVKIYPKNIGYELRCHSPIAFDIEYTRFLGYGAVRLLEEGRTDVMITRDFDRLGFQALSELIQKDGSVKSRKVDLGSDLYKVARSFMIRATPDRKVAQ